ncbi:MAG: lipoprotein-releasing ABC transporter permease subunit [Rhodospirillales bacterium]
MFQAFEWIIAARYLRSRRREGFISVIAWFSLLGIALGVATLIIVMAVMNGFRQELLSRILGLNGHITVIGGENRIRGFDAAAQTLMEIEGVTAAVPMVEGQVMATRGGVSRGAVVRGLRADDLFARDVIADSVTPEAQQAFRAGNAVLIGRRMAENMGLLAGGRIKLISPTGVTTAFGTVPRVGAYDVAGVFEAGMYEYDSSFIFMPLETAQIFFRAKGAATHLSVMVEDADDAPKVMKKMRGAIPPGAIARDWQRVNAGFFNAIQVERNVMFLILTLIILVAAFNVVSSLIMLVKDKGRDIAVLRTMGATKGSVMRIFFLSGASIGVAGTVAGFVLGLTFSLNIETIRQWLEGLTGTELFAAEIYFLSKLPAEVAVGEVITVVLIALTLSFLATLYPSWRAARIDPAEALRYE